MYDTASYLYSLMSKLSSTTLFHFTHTFEVLVKILEEGLWPRYCVERDWGDKDLLIPMVCTCDIPLSEMTVHQKKYGKYGIGVGKGWAKRNNFTPVLYVSERSDIFRILSNYAKEHLLQPILPGRTSFDEEYMLHYVKRVVGTDADRESLGLPKRPKFINEREWRYVPWDIPMSFVCKGKGGTMDCSRLSRLTVNKKLKLTPDDIEYIFVEKEDEREAIIREIHRIYEGEGQRVVDELISRVASSEQREKDF